MPEQSESVATEESPVSPATDDTALGEAGERALAAEREARRAADKRARELERELASLRQSSMSEAERAVAEAEARGRAGAVTELGRDLARARFDAAAGRRNPALTGAELDGLLEFVDIGRFVGDDGRPDVKAIDRAVERIVPAVAGAPRPPDLDLGGRRPATAGSSFNDLLRAATGRGV